MSKPVAKITIEFEHEGQPMRVEYECNSLPIIVTEAGHRDYIQSIYDPPEVRKLRWVESGGRLYISADLPSRNNFAQIEERIRNLTRATDS